MEVLSWQLITTWWWVGSAGQGGSWTDLVDPNKLWGSILGKSGWNLLQRGFQFSSLEELGSLGHWDGVDHVLCLHCQCRAVIDKRSLVHVMAATPGPGGRLKSLYMLLWSGTVPLSFLSLHRRSMPSPFLYRKGDFFCQVEDGIQEEQC